LKVGNFTENAKSLNEESTTWVKFPERRRGHREDLGFPLCASVSLWLIDLDLEPAGLFRIVNPQLRFAFSEFVLAYRSEEREKQFVCGRHIGLSDKNANLIKMPTDYTFSLVPSVTVIAVQNPAADASTGKPTAGTSTFVLDLSPSDASNVVFAVDHSTLYMGLLPSQNKEGYNGAGVIGAPYARVIGVKG